MNGFRAFLFVALAGVAFAGCTDDGSSTAQYRNAVTGEACQPDPGTLVPVHGHNGQGSTNGGHRSPTGIPGDNLDDLHSGKMDCLGDGDSGQGNDARKCCDASSCCSPGGDDDGGDEPPPTGPVLT
jgi:hypothetical protein